MWLDAAMLACLPELLVTVGIGLHKSTKLTVL